MTPSPGVRSSIRTPSNYRKVTAQVTPTLFRVTPRLRPTLNHPHHRQVSRPPTSKDDSHLQSFLLFYLIRMCSHTTRLQVSFSTLFPGPLPAPTHNVMKPPYETTYRLHIIQIESVTFLTLFYSSRMCSHNTRHKSHSQLSPPGRLTASHLRLRHSSTS